MIKRQHQILNIMSDGHEVTVGELSKALGVSPATVRQDLTALENEGFLRRVHGGAVLDQVDDISHRMAFNYNKKLAIAKTASSLVKDNETIFIESGSVNALLVKELQNKKNLTIITSNAFIARQIRHDTNLNVILLGGIYQTESECMVGNLAKFCLEQLHYGKAFIGVDGFTFDSGFTGRDMMRAEINSLIIKKASEVIIVSDSTKFGKIALSQYCTADDVDIIITNDDLDKEYTGYFSERGINILLAEE